MPDFEAEQEACEDAAGDLALVQGLADEILLPSWLVVFLTLRLVWLPVRLLRGAQVLLLLDCSCASDCGSDDMMSERLLKVRELRVPFIGT